MKKKTVQLMKVILFILILSIIGYISYQSKDEFLLKIDSNLTTQITIIVSLFALVTTYLVHFREVKISFYNNLFLVLSFLIVISINFLLSFGIVKDPKIIHVFLLFFLMVNVLLVFYIFICFFKSKFLYPEFKSIELKHNSLLRKFKKNSQKKDLEKSIMYLCNWANKNKYLKNDMNMHQFFLSVKKISIEGIRSQITSKLSGKDENFDLKKLLEITFETVIIINNIKNLKRYIDALDSIINAAINIDNFELARELCKYIFTDVYEACLQKSNNWYELILNYYIKLISNKEKVKTKYREIITDMLELNVIQIQKYEYTISEFSIDIFYQEILNNYSFFKEHLEISKFVRIISMILKSSQQIHKNNETYFEFNKLINFVSKIEELDENLKIVDLMSNLLKNNNKMINEVIIIIFENLYKKFENSKLMIFKKQIELADYLEINPCEFDLNLILKIILEEVAIDEVKNYDLLYSFASLLRYNEGPYYRFFSKLIKSLDDLKINHNQQKKVSDFIKIIVRYSLLNNLSTDEEQIIYGVKKYYNYLLDYFSKDSERQEREEFFNRYMEQINDMYLHSSNPNNKAKIIMLLMNYIDVPRENERKLSFKYTLDVSYRSLEEDNFEVTESASNILGWTLFDHLKRLKNNSREKFRVNILNEINSLFNCVVKYSRKKTSVFMGTLYVVNYTFCKLYQYKSKQIDFALKRFEDYFSKIDLNATEILIQSVTLRMKNTFSYFEDDNSVDEQKIQRINHELKEALESKLKK